ncbi:MAG: DUF4157 domain-containing protein [Gemmatimonadales bacterium]
MSRHNAVELPAGLTDTASPRLGRDFSRIPTHSRATGAIQTKLAASRPGDEYEQEADHLSDQVMRMPESTLQRACHCGGTCRGCQMEQAGNEPEPLQTKRIGSNDPASTPAPSTVYEVLASPGYPLDAASRAFMEPRFGHDFSRVRVHTGANAAESARAVGAHAYTVGHDIVFGAGQLVPGTTAGRRLLAHELTHVIQQAGGRAQRHVARTASLEPRRDEEEDTTADSSLILQRDLAIEPPRPRAIGRTLTAAEMQAAIAFDQRVVGVIGAAGLHELRDVLGISPEPAVVDEDFVRAVVQWQAMQGLGQDGRLGPTTANRLFREIGAEQVGRGQLVSGPTYHATTALTPPVAAGLQQGGHRFEAEFADDPANGLYASCCELRQFIQWDAPYAAAAPGGPPHAGFPAGTAAGTWIEDRDGGDVLRYGHRSGPHSASLGAGNEYRDNTGHRNAAFGSTYRGRDFPGTHRLHAGHWRFMVRAIDVCNGNNRLGDDFLRFTW